MSDETIGDGPFQGIVIPCDTCLGLGTLIRLGPQAVIWGECPDCSGTGHRHIRCTEDEVDDVIRRIPLMRQQLQTRDVLTAAGLCFACFGSKVVASIDCDENDNPIRYLEASCPMCT